MVLEFKNGQMELDTKVNGNIIKLMEKVSLLMLMVMFTMEIGKMIWQMELEYIFIKVVLNMKENGFVINNMDMERKHGKMVHGFKDFIKKV